MANIVEIPLPVNNALDLIVDCGAVDSGKKPEPPKQDAPANS